MSETLTTVVGSPEGTQPIRVTDDYLKGHMARAIPGAYWDKEGKAWMLSAPTPRAAAVALRLFPELAASAPELLALRAALAADVRPFDQATPYDRPLANTLAELYRFQAIDLGYVCDVLDTHGGAYIGWQMGLGKTLGTCAIIDKLRCQRTLVVAPNTAKTSVWAAELARWLPSHQVLVLPNEKTKRERMLRSLLDRPATPGGAGAVHAERPGDGLAIRSNQQGSEQPFVLVIHYEALALVAGKAKKNGRTVLGDGWKRYGEWDLFVADEAHRLKNPKALMTKAAKKVPSARRLALSGSIIQNNAEELFSPLQWLFPATYKSAWRDFNDRFLDYVESAYGKVCVGIKPDAVERLRHELGVFTVVRRKDDELDLPAKTEQTLLVDLTHGQRKVYTELVESMLAELPDGSRIKAADGLVLLTRLRQVATGLDLFGNVADSSKLDLALEMIEDNPDEAFVVFAWYRAANRALAERLEANGIQTWLVDGDVKQEDRAEFIKRFQAGEGRVFLGTISTLGESVTLTRASQCIRLDRSWNPQQNSQAEDRLHRIGQERPVTVHDIVARDTVDELRVLPALASKQALRQVILGGGV